jgi:hypothetical protein
MAVLLPLRLRLLLPKLLLVSGAKIVLPLR